MDDDSRKKMGVVRVGALGALVSARLERGERVKLFEEAAERTYERPDGQPFTVEARTVEDWYYAFKHGGFEALLPRQRSDAGSSRVITPEVGELLVSLKLENPRRSLRRLVKTLEREGVVAKGELKKSTVHRFLQRRGLSTRPRRAYEERRAFRHPFAGDLWMEDVMHGPRVLMADGSKRKAYLHLLLDSATRFVPAAVFRLGETASDLEAVLKEAILKHGLPRVLYLDWGAAQRSDSLALICAELGVRLLHCRPYDPESKAGVERIFRTVREELLDELGDRLVALADLNSLLWSWLSAEYHRRLHSGTGQIPLEHWLSQVDHLRPAPSSEVLDDIFLHRERRTVRKDSTVRFAGRLLEVRPELARSEIELRFDPERPSLMPRVFVDDTFYCDTVELDVIRNSRRRRRRISPDENETATERPATGIDPLRQIQAEHERRLAPPSRRRLSRREA